MYKFIIYVNMSIVFNVCCLAGKPELTFKNDGKFRIVQLTDIHHVVNNPASKEVLSGLSDLLDSVRPDLVFFTGDIVVSKEMKQGWDEVLGIVIKRHIPWAVVLGNHDDEYGSSRTEIIKYIITKPYNLTEFGPKNIQGCGNYYLRIKSSSKNKTAFILYGLDSNSYAKDYKKSKYGFFNFNQIDWFRHTNEKLSGENNSVPYPSLAFFHIPLIEYEMLKDSSEYIRIGQRNEKESVGAINTGMYAAMLQSKSVMGIFTGHDHVNDYIGLLNGICLAYGRFSGGKTTYGNLMNGARVIELNENKKGFKSWIYDTGNNISNVIEYDGAKLKSLTKM